MDKRDKTILEALWKNSRTKNNEIAKKLKVTPRTIAKHILQLNQKGLENMIEIDFPTVNLLNSMFIKIKLDKRQHIDYNSLKRYLLAKKEIYFAASTKGDFDILLLVATRNMREYAEFIDNLRIKIPYKSTVSYVYLSKYTGFIPPTKELIDMLCAERYDKLILKQLQQDSKTTFSDMAKPLEVSVTSAVSRFEKLKNLINCKSAITEIKNFKIFIEFIGCEYKSDEELDKILNFLAKHANNVYGISGNYDLLSIYVFKSWEECSSFPDVVDKSLGKYILSREKAELTEIIKGKLPVHPKFI